MYVQIEYSIYSTEYLIIDVKVEKRENSSKYGEEKSREWHQQGPVSWGDAFELYLEAIPFYRAFQKRWHRAT